MEIKEIKKNQVTVLMVEGRLDSGTSGTLEKNLISAIEAGEKNLVLDFTGMDYISSAGLRVLLMAAKKTNKLGGMLVLSALNPNVREVFDIAGFTNIFSIFNSLEDAVKTF